MVLVPAGMAVLESLRVACGSDANYKLGHFSMPLIFLTFLSDYRNNNTCFTGLL